ncbi:DUF2182 domain-containing protein [Nonomuraea sp. NPDC050536]|uniref:DUF2182 domain-containing protein n=1 Tax=Nonomuraea sp. NPDC050536 TaxID=3364366 RepID=UPI0037C9D550
MAGGTEHGRHFAPAWAAILVFAALAWIVTLQQAGGMGVGPGTMGLTLPIFLALWVIMMAAMMLPSVAPVALGWARAIRRRTSGLAQAGRIVQFLLGYLVVWAAFGALVFGLLALTDRWLGAVPEAGRWIGAAAFALAGLQQFGPLKRVCLRHCRSPFTQLLHYSRFGGPGRDFRVGAHHGLYCVGCCWGLMIVLIPLGVMNVAAMAGLAVLIFLEKLWRYGRTLATVAGVAFLVLAALAPFQPWLLPGLSMQGS